VIKNGHKVLFIGDSITDSNRHRAHAPLGDGYVKLFRDLMLFRQPTVTVQVVNKGIGGNKVTQLRDRWADDVLRERPDWLSIKVGINDLISHLCSPDDPVTPRIYAEVYDGVLSRTRQALPACRILLIDPFFLSLEPFSETLWRGRVLKALPDYLEVVQELSEKYETRHLKTHERFQHLLQSHSVECFAPEPVHPHTTGHLAIAEWVYDELNGLG
jgi:lysophospholipase L1-like esterase